MIGVLAARLEPGRFAKLVLVTPSPCYIDDGDYRGGFSRADIDELLESLSDNYLGWSATMAPVIMGNPERPELGEELTNSFCQMDPTSPRCSPGPRSCPTTAPTSRRSGPDAGAAVRPGRDRPTGGRSVRARAHPGERAGHARRHRALSAAQRAGRDRRTDHRVRHVRVTRPSDVGGGATAALAGPWSMRPPVGARRSPRRWPQRTPPSRNSTRTPPVAICPRCPTEPSSRSTRRS